MSEGIASGGAYLFELLSGGASAVTELVACDYESGGEFGHAVDIDGVDAIVGAVQFTQRNGQSSGTSFAFSRDVDGPDAWGCCSTLRPGTGSWQNGDRFGSAVRIDTTQGLFVVGAARDEDSVFADGLVYVSEIPCPADVDFDNTVGFSDLLAVLADFGNPVFDPVLDINADGVIDFADILAILAAWGPCSCTHSIAPSSLADELAAVGLDMSDWNAYLNALTNGKPEDADCHKCWWDAYIYSVASPACDCPDPYDQTGTGGS